MSKEKLTFYSPIKEEAGVIMVFTKIHKQLGFPKIVSSSSRGFDIDNIEYHDDLGIHKVTIEFEYLSSNYLIHGHQDLMQDDKKYIVICWEDDCNLSKKLITDYEKHLYKIIELKNLVEILPNNIIEDYITPKYYLINYNPKYADNRIFSDWSNSNIYRFINNKNIKITDGSKALIKQGSHIIGGFDIIRFSNIKLKNNDEIIELYKRLTDYPVTLFNVSKEEIKNEYCNNYIGHIFYKNLFEIDNINLRKSIKELLPDLKISHSAIQSLTEKQYNTLLGIN